MNQHFVQVIPWTEEEIGSSEMVTFTVQMSTKEL